MFTECSVTELKTEHTIIRASLQTDNKMDVVEQAISYFVPKQIESIALFDCGD